MKLGKYSVFSTDGVRSKDFDTREEAVSHAMEYHAERNKLGNMRCFVQHITDVIQAAGPPVEVLSFDSVKTS